MQEKKYDVVCIGLVVADILLQPVDPGVFTVDTTRLDNIDLMPGGDAMNQAITLANHGVNVALSAQVGDDAFGNVLKQQAKLRGVAVTHMLLNAKTSTSICVVMIQPSGQRNFVYATGNNDCFRYEDVSSSLWSEAKVISLGSLLGLRDFDSEKIAEGFRTAQATGTITVADTAHDSHGLGLKSILPILPHIDYFIPSLEEAQLLLGAQEPQVLAASFLQYGAKNVVLKLGAEGCLVMNAQEHFFLPTYQVQVVDTTGCGDNFTSGFILGLLRNESLRRCGQIANALGSFNATSKGATSSQKRTFQDVLGFMEATPLMR